MYVSVSVLVCVNVGTCVHTTYVHTLKHAHTHTSKVVVYCYLLLFVVV